MMHQYKILLRVFMAKRLHIAPSSYACLGRGTYGCSAPTLMFFILIMTEQEVIQLRMDFRTLVEKEIEHEVA